MINAIGKNINSSTYQPHIKQNKVNFTSQSDKFVHLKENNEKKELSNKAKWNAVCITLGFLIISTIIATLIAILTTKCKNPKPANYTEHINYKQKQITEKAQENEALELLSMDLFWDTF